MARLTLLLLPLLAFATAAAALEDPEFKPAPQTSVSSTSFNPALTNPGGSTNAAGTFAVSSLARSSSYSYDSSLPKTTSFVVESPDYASAQAVVTPSGFNAPIVTSVPLLTQSSSHAVSLVTTTSVSVAAAPSSRPDGAAARGGAAAGWAVGALGVVAAFAL